MPERILSLDPSLRCFGIAVWEGLSLNTALAINTEREAKKRRIYSGDDDCRRLGMIEHALWCWKDAGWIEAVMEMPAGSQSNRGAESNGMMKGLVVGVFGFSAVRFVQARDVKKAATGKYGASKEQMVAWAKEHYPVVFQARMNKPKQEAVADALAVMVAYRGENYAGRG